MGLSNHSPENAGEDGNITSGILAEGFHRPQGFHEILHLHNIGSGERSTF